MRNVGGNATKNRESVTGVVQKDGAVDKIGQEMDAMVQLVDQITINVFSIQQFLE